MDRMIYVAMTGAREAMRAQSRVAHTIANASTQRVNIHVTPYRKPS